MYWFNTLSISNRLVYVSKLGLKENLERPFKEIILSLNVWLNVNTLLESLYIFLQVHKITFLYQSISFGTNTWVHRC